jgi:hypothetical protein
MDTVHKYVGTRADHLIDGRPIAPGRLVRRVDPTDPLLKRGLLIEHSVEETTQTEETEEPAEQTEQSVENEGADKAQLKRRGRKDTLSDSSGK